MSELETIPEETGLPRISQLIPKSPETIKREIESKQICDKYLNDTNLKLYYAMLVTNKNFRQLCTNSDSSWMHNDNNQIDVCPKIAAAHGNIRDCVEKKPSKSANKCNVSTTISEEDINYLYNGESDVKKCNILKPFHPSNTNAVKWNNCSRLNGDGELRLDVNEINSFNADGNGRKVSTTKMTAAAAPAKKRTVSTSIPTEDIKMLCANLVRFSNGSVKNLRE